MCDAGAVHVFSETAFFEEVLSKAANLLGWHRRCQEKVARCEASGNDVKTNSGIGNAGPVECRRIFKAARMFSTVPRRETSGNNAKQIPALKMPDNSHRVFNAAKHLPDMYQTLHVWLPSKRIFDAILHLVPIPRENRSIGIAIG